MVIGIREVLKVFIVAIIICLRSDVVMGCDGDSTGIGTGRDLYLEDRCFIYRSSDLAGHGNCAILSFQRVGRCLFLRYMGRVYPVPMCLDSLELCFRLGDSVDFVLRMDTIFRLDSFLIYVLSYDMGDYREIYMLVVGVDGRILGFCGVGWSYYSDRYEYSYVRIDSVVGKEIYLTSVESAGLVLMLGRVSDIKWYIDSVLSSVGVRLGVTAFVDAGVDDGANSNGTEICLERHHIFNIELVIQKSCAICVSSFGLVDYRLNECVSGP